MLGGLSQPRDPLPECREVGWQPPKAVSMALPSTPQSWTVHREGRAARGLLQGQLLRVPTADAAHALGQSLPGRRAQAPLGVQSRAASGVASLLREGRQSPGRAWAGGGLLPQPALPDGRSQGILTSREILRDQVVMHFVVTTHWVLGTLVWLWHGAGQDPASF